MTRYSYKRTADGARPLGLVVLQSDETIEGDMRRMMPAATQLHVTRVPSAEEVTPASLRAMADHITTAAGLLPKAMRFSSIGYGCTSATAQIGAANVANLIRQGAPADLVTDPLSALVAACRALKIERLAFLSPYTADVSSKLRAALAEAGIETPVFGSFEEANEASVVRIDEHSIKEAACDLVRKADVQAVFLSCTNLRTLDVIKAIETRTGLVCLSSNQVLAWHLCEGANVPGRLNAALRPS
ncbi:maleate cis-trans isomerase family protein [Sulfitobacter donghicola]|uniref:Asp/Glu racemase n=1 Tax=Sulfitobacter donghicola DSW-25 = KCTC 12864 = JCM 14565 TaxID=1300350 RepID=A0A073IK04_9RHOB|nr:aspartate/glutamate racemase family protein [Sulfitobacter donghicola]KEJ89856.1 Asp/Glu racemase [Sulfitobacter donghicola DSW-25 = KCTC 12864 = JCM 14565]KIN67023.1 Asp/Glu racemase [Sulfitobacter donghicola DSW-25 = KCTC 12864 = JCM 14565]